MSDTVYEMMMKIGLHGGIFHDLTRVSDALTRMHLTVTRIGEGFTAWHTALAGVGFLLAGGAVITGVVKLAESATKWQEALIKAQRQSVELGEMVKSGELQNRTFDIAKRVGLSVEDLISIPTTLFSITGKDEALHLWEPLAKYSTLDKHKGSDEESALKALVRAGELTGRFVDNEGNFDSKKAQEFLDLMVKIKNATHGMVNEQTIYGFASKAGTSARGLTDAGFMMEAIQMQAMGGAQAGTSLMSLWQQMAGGTMFNRTAKGLEDMGLLGKDEWSSKGGRVILSDEASKRLTKLIGKDPTDLTVAIINALAEKGITDPEDRQRMIMRMLNRQTTQRMMTEMVVNRRQQHAERERMASGMGADDSFKLREDKSIEYNMKRLSAAWHNLMIAIAGPNSENFIAILQSLTRSIYTATNYVRGMDPATIAAIEKGALVLGGALVVLGTAAVISAATWVAGGVLTTATAAIAGMIIAMAGGQHISNAIDSTITGFNKFIDFLISLPGRGIDKLIEGLNPVMTAIGKFFDWISWLVGKADLSQYMVPKKSSFEGGSPFDSSGRVVPVNFNPGNRPTQILQPVTLTLNIDGHQMGQVLGEIAQDAAIHPTGPPDANGWAYFRPMGNQDTA